MNKNATTVPSVPLNSTELQAPFFLVVPHSFALLHIISSIQWGSLCVGGEMSQSYYFSSSLLCSVALEGPGRPDIVQLWAWVRVLATHSVWLACSMPFPPREVNRHLSLVAATSPPTHSPIHPWVETQWQPVQCFLILYLLTVTVNKKVCGACGFYEDQWHFISWGRADLQIGSVKSL